MDTFVIKKVYSNVPETIINNQDYSLTNNTNVTNKIITDNSYTDENIQITITNYREYDTSIYVADIIINNPFYLKTDFAHNSYGKNVTEKTSSIAKNNNAILAINGDYYGVQESGYVLRNGIIYRSTKSNNKEDLVIFKDGSFDFINEGDLNLTNLLNKNAYNVLSFGPCLLLNNNIMVSENEEVR